MRFGFEDDSKKIDRYFQKIFYRYFSNKFNRYFQIFMTAIFQIFFDRYFSKLLKIFRLSSVTCNKIHTVLQFGLTQTQIIPQNQYCSLLLQNILHVISQITPFPPHPSRLIHLNANFPLSVPTLYESHPLFILQSKSNIMQKKIISMI